MKRSVRIILLMLFAVAVIRPTFAQLSVTVSFGPPALPVYDQPACPGDGYLWTPGYWAYDDDDGYYWVPGTWVEAPEPGYLWTPGWWGWGGSGYLFHEGYWATDVGFYGGIYYGFGYFGEGFEGGRWQGDRFFYNRAVLNVDVTNIHNVYNTTVIQNVTVNRVSYNGGEGGTMARPSVREQAVDQQRHIPPVEAQSRHIEAARANPQMRAEANHGKPAVAATSRPGEFTGRGVVEARSEGAPYRPAPPRQGSPSAGGERQAQAPGRSDQGNMAGPRTDSANHARDLQPHQADVAPSSGDPRTDLQYQKQQQKLVEQQNREHQKLQQQQDKEDQRAAKYSADTQKQQQVEQRHQQQTQQLEQKHTEQQQQLRSKQPAPKPASHKPE